MKQLCSSLDGAELELLANQLQDVGIGCEVRGQSQVIPGIPFGPELWVLRDEDYTRASEFLSAWRNPPADLSLDAGVQNLPEADCGDGRSLDSIITALYRTISGPGGEERDWDQFRKLFHPKAQFMRTSISAEGEAELTVMGLQEFIDFATPYFHSRPFYEREVFRRVEQFSHLAQVFSTFEASSDERGCESLGKGINSVQLWSDSRRWWVMTLLWDDERPGNSIPSRYLPP